MAQDERTYHRQERMAAIARWAAVGTQEKRRPLPIEADFLKRVEKANRPLFIPLEVQDGETVQFHQQVSYLVDAFDGLPTRVDVAFDSTWKAFESASEVIVHGNITERLSKLAKSSSIDEVVLNELLKQIPAQSCEFLFKRIIGDSSGTTDGDLFSRQPNKRLWHFGDDEIVYLIRYLNDRYSANEPDIRRKGAMLLRRAIQGEELTLGERQMTLSLNARSAMLLHGLLYTSRNERVHGESFSPFVSSTASIKTYTHPYFSFLASYSLLLCVWAAEHESKSVNDVALVRANLKRNLDAAADVFGRHWLR